MAASSSPSSPNSLEISIPGSCPPPEEVILQGSSLTPDGSTLSYDAQSLLLNGERWMPVMGEFHFSRCPADEWRDGLLKMRAGGITVVASYVFWIHHEEERGILDWSGSRNLRRFIELAGQTGHKVIVRLGPWCHGEVRNGGLPDWILDGHGTPRSNDLRYLEEVRRYYGAIAQQLEGLLWKDGGPVIGMQLENEFDGPAEHLLSLKQIAQEVGLETPLYTRTGWPALATPMPANAMLPLFGAYAEGFWDRELTSMPGKYWAAFRFSEVRTDAAIGTDQLGERDAEDEKDAHQHPYLTCELGGGMVSSYHRRIAIDPLDVEAVALVKIGSGGNAPGYYMYHGGLNPKGKLTTLHESQASGYANDVPLVNYDFEAPIGAFGQIRPHYHGLRRMHLAWNDFGSWISGLRSVLPETQTAGSPADETVRWAVRSDGESGLLFVNNHERGRHLPPHDKIRFALKLPGRDIHFPDKPIAIPSDAAFFLPFRLNLAPGVTIEWATVEPLCRVKEKDGITYFFAAIDGIPPQIAMGGESTAQSIQPSFDSALERKASDGALIRCVVLSAVDSRRLWKDPHGEEDRVFWSEADLIFDLPQIRLTQPGAGPLNLGIYPPLPGKSSTRKGVFQWIEEDSPDTPPSEIRIEPLRVAGRPRKIPLGTGAQPVALAPSDDHFAQAAVWRLHLPPDLDLSANPILRIQYLGDVARLTLNGELMIDDFYHDRPLEVGLRRFGPRVLESELELAILPLRQDAPIYHPSIPGKALIMIDGIPAALELSSVQIIVHREHRIQLTLD